MTITEFAEQVTREIATADNPHAFGVCVEDVVESVTEAVIDEFGVTFEVAEAAADAAAAIVDVIQN
jgi:hypothetical protein